MKISEAGAVRILGALSIAFVIGSVAIYVPAGIYSANQIDFVFPLATLLAVGLPWAALATCLLALPLAARNVTLLRSLAAAWFALAVSVWVSASFLVSDIGVLDGRTQINIPVSEAILSVVALLAAASLSALAAYRVPRRALVAVVCVTIAQLGGSLFQMATASPRGRPGMPEADPAAVADLFRLSDQKNVLVIVLDTFQSNLFEDYLQKNPSIREELDGFTFYRNTTGSAPTTYASMPPIHSGVRFDPERSLKEVYEEQVHSGSFVGGLAQSGYQASVVNTMVACPAGAQCLEDRQVSDRAGQRIFSFLSLLDVSLLRVAPAPLKSWVFNNGAWRVRRLSDDARTETRPIRHQRFLKRFSGNIHVASVSPTVKFIHLMTTHPPIEMNDACAPLPEPLRSTRANFSLPVTCSIETIRHLLARLKSIGVYDLSFIGIIADHGAGLLPEPKSHRIGGAAMPLLLVKPISAQGALRISDRPAEIRDLAATVCKETSDCRSLDGIPLDELPESRLRSFFYYIWKNEYWNDDRIQPVNEFLIDGPVWQPASWQKLHTGVLPTDQTVLFNASFPEQANFLDWGWSSLEPWGVWSDGPSASLSFLGAAAPRSPVDLIFDTTSYVTPETPVLSVSMRANGHPIGNWKIQYPQAEATLHAQILPEMWGGGERMTIQLDIDRDVPLEDLPNAPPRMLGIGLRSVRLETKTAGD